MEPVSLGYGTAEAFFRAEFEHLELKDKRLNRRALQILLAQQSRPTSCVRRLFLEETEMRQTYDFF
jgi:hypothetical protein